MKKILFTIIFLFIPVIVLGAECPTIIDKQTNDDRELTCDFENNNQTITKFSTTSEKTILTNDVCSVKCTESVVFSIDPIKKVLAGTSFNYPLYVSGERKCKATYDYVNYEATITKLVDEYNTLTGDAKTTKGNELVNYYDQKKQCDEFIVEDSDYHNTYKMSGSVKLNVQTSKSTETLTYKYKNISDYYSESNIDEVKYYACDYNEATRKCDESMRTIASWTETARIFGKYTMPTVYVEKYTGEVKSASTATTCNASDRFFVGFNELTNPKVGDIDNNGYKLTLIADKLGNNLIPAENTWKLKVNCWYQVKNLSFPNGGATIPDSDTDENYISYGNMAFKYRLISLTDPFPNREAGANWFGKESLITDEITTDPKFTIDLNAQLNGSAINSIKQYNRTNPYVTFKMFDDGTRRDISYFIENFDNIIKRGS